LALVATLARHVSAPHDKEREKGDKRKAAKERRKRG
jgi:hypothetical protein